MRRGAAVGWQGLELQRIDCEPVKKDRLRARACKRRRATGVLAARWTPPRWKMQACSAVLSLVPAPAAAVAPEGVVRLQQAEVGAWHTYMLESRRTTQHYLRSFTVGTIQNRKREARAPALAC